jgi:hypothetical protein
VHRRIAASALLAALALCAFGSPARASAAPAAPPAPPPGTDVAACYDGTCTLTVSGPVDIPLDGRAGLTGLSVTGVGPYAVTFTVHSATGGGLGMTGTGGSVRFGSSTGTVAVRVLSLGGGTAVLDLATTTT